MLWGLAWYWWAVILGLLIPWTRYTDMRDEFDEGFAWGLKIYLGVSAVTVSAMLAVGFVSRWYFGNL